MRNISLVQALYVLSLLFVVFLDQIDGACPNYCSGHGQCQNDNTCECEDLYNAVPDCSLRKFVFTDYNYLFDQFY